MPDRDEFEKGQEGTTDASGGESVEARREQFEAKRVSRRDALKKMAVTAGFSAALLFSNDFLRLVVGKLNRASGDEAMADTLSEGLSKAGSLIAPVERFQVARHEPAILRPVSSKKPALLPALTSSKKPALLPALTSSKKPALAR